MEQAPRPSPPDDEVERLSSEADEHARRLLGASAVADQCPRCGFSLDLPPPRRGLTRLASVMALTPNAKRVLYGRRHEVPTELDRFTDGEKQRLTAEVGADAVGLLIELDVRTGLKIMVDND